MQTTPQIIESLRAQHAQGRHSADLLRYLDSRGLSPVEMMDHFREAFGLDSYDAGAIGGWFADGSGELNDDDINRLLDPVLSSAQK
jgi:hypothetical protein